MARPLQRRIFASKKQRKESEHFILDNINLVHSVAQRFTRDTTSVLYQELYSEGIVGLVESASRYKRGDAKFTSYAYHRIRGAMLNYLNTNKSLLRLPRGKSCNTAGVNVVSLSVCNDHLECAHQRDLPEIEYGYMDVELWESVRSLLSEREYNTLLLKYKGYTQVEISRQMGLSESSVSNIMISARKRLRDLLLNS